MLIRSRVLGSMMALALVAGACSGDDNNGAGGASGGGVGGGTGGSSGTEGGTGGSVGTGGTTDASTGAGGGTGGSTGAGGTTDGAADARADGAAGSANTDGGDAAPAPRCGPFADGGMYSPVDAGTPAATMSFFVTSDTSLTGNLGGLSGADTRCQNLAAAVGAGGKTWHAYLSTSTVNARDRIGTGPWFNAKGVMVAADLTALHARTGDPSVFITEIGNLVNGQWTGAPTPNEHDILTGSNADGTVAVGKTFQDWMSAVGPSDAAVPDGGDLGVARIGHADGFGPMCATANPISNTGVSSWNSAHDNRGCNDTRPAGGIGRLYCFAVNSDAGSGDQ